ncbi:MAG: helix-turn-helix domain-containing protein [Candidatus Competibacteraceae bacterium]|nr:helix-turn-helix domain-containing protein [Candidatus Competibacteraceae bacterium]
MLVDMTTSKPPHKASNRAIWLKHQLEIHGTSYAKIAREEGVTRQAARKVVYSRSSRMEAAIARRLGLMPKQIWPERYPHDA